VKKEKNTEKKERSLIHMHSDFGLPPLHALPCYLDNYKVETEQKQASKDKVNEFLHQPRVAILCRVCCLQSLQFLIATKSLELAFDAP